MTTAHAHPPSRPHVPSLGPPKTPTPPNDQLESAELKPVTIEVEIVGLSGDQAGALRVAQTRVIHKILLWFSQEDTRSRSGERMGSDIDGGPV